jgi:DNA-binding TFAR19-related protein (PDSD5 family)
MSSEFSQYLRKPDHELPGDNEQEESKENEFSQYLRKSHENIAPKKAGRSELAKFIMGKEEKSYPKKGARIFGQYALGAAENALLPYEIAIAPLGNKEAQGQAYRDLIFEDINRLQEQKEMGAWDEKDQKLYDHLIDQVKNPEKAEKYVQTADLGIRHAVEKLTGLDLKPEGALEKAANWTGFIKNPKKIAELGKLGLKTKDVLKAISPSGGEILRGVGAGTALQLAEDGQFGPIGTMGAIIIGDILGAGTAGAAKALLSPKKTLAKIAAKFTPKDKLKLQKEIIKDFRESGIQADIGSITNSDLLKWTQSRLAQSGLTGKALDDLKQSITSQIEHEYKGLAEGLGEAKFANSHEAGEIVKESIKKIRDSELSETRKLYDNAKKSLKETSVVDSRNLAKSISRLESELKPGKIKSSEQNVVLNTLENLKKDVFDETGKLKYASVQDLINNKIALNDIINYEVQGGTKQLLKGIVADLDRAIISHGKDNIPFVRNYVNANKKFSEHAKIFRNKNINEILRSHDPAQLMNKMNSVQGIRDLGKILSKTSEGKETFNNLKRLQMDKLIGDNLIDSTSKQAKLGTFSKLLEKGKNREIMREILTPDAFKRLENLQKNAGRLADAAQKFYNASKSGTVAVDAAIIAKGLGDVAHLLSGNPWPMTKTAGGFIVARQLSNLLADSAFLKLVEEAIIAAEKNTPESISKSVERLRPYILPIMQEPNDEEQETGSEMTP